jgi:hypothetical protein
MHHHILDEVIPQTKHPLNELPKCDLRNRIMLNYGLRTEPEEVANN